MGTCFNHERLRHRGRATESLDGARSAMAGSKHKRTGPTKDELRALALQADSVMIAMASQPVAVTHAMTDRPIAVTFARKDEAKHLGARWEPRRKTWFIPKGRALAPFQSAGLI
jgi:hypothetical protein